MNNYTTLYNMIQEEQAAVYLMQAKAAEASIELNNGAVAFLLSGHHALALQNLQQALARLLSLRETTSSLMQHCYQHQQLEDEVSFLSSTALPRSWAPDGQEEDIFKFFNRAIALPSHDADFCLSLSSSPRNRNRALATILYNIAICYHLQGLHSGNEQAFGIALNYYGQAYYTIEHASKEFGFQDVLLLVLALFNNMGHIHNTTYVNSEKTRQCVYWMQSTFRSQSAKKVLGEDDYSFFFQYISVASNQQLLIAPAA